MSYTCEQRQHRCECQPSAVVERTHLMFLVLLLGALLFNTQSSLAEEGDAPPLRAIDEEVQDLKSEVLALNRDLFILEEELLFPSNTQVTVFLSFDVGTLFSLDAVELEIDGKQVASHLYTQREVDALVRGGVQKLFVGNLRAGDHELVARFTGKGPHGRDYRRGTTLEFDKSLGTRYIELQIHDSQRKQQPEFVARVWE